MSIRSAAALLVCLTLGVRESARAQCQRWADGFGASQMGMDGTSTALAEFDDGNGPALYAAGSFSVAGGVAVNRIARWNGVSWSPLGSGMNAGVAALAVFDDGTGTALYAGGNFTLAGGVPANRIAKWNGTSWSPLLLGMDQVVAVLAVFDDGTGPALYAGGDFASASGVSANRIAKWNGASWSSLGSGMGNGAYPFAGVYALEVFDDGAGPKLYAAGYFGSAGGVIANNIARWNGSSWSALGAGTNNYVFALAAFDDGAGSALYAGGLFGAAGGSVANLLAKWNGSAWSAVGSGIDGAYVTSLATFDDGSGSALYVGGEIYQAGGIATSALARWSGSGWSNVDGGLSDNGHAPPNVVALGVADDLTGGGPDLWASGEFMHAGSFTSSYVAKFQGCSSPGTPLCFGDGSGAACPCGNSGSARHGCKNSATTDGAALVATGTTVPDTVVLHAYGELPSALSIFMQGTITIAPAAFGDGLRCAGGNLKRLYVKSASGGAVSAPGPGDLSITARSAALGAPIPPGHRRYYQVYYRDAAAGFCPPPSGATFNVTNGIKLEW